MRASNRRPVRARARTSAAAISAISFRNSSAAAQPPVLDTAPAGAAAAVRHADFPASISTPRGAEPARAPDLRAEVRIPLVDAVKGAKRRLDLVAEDECATCRGSGMIAREEKQGKARVIRSAEQCPTCGGVGVVQARRMLEVTIPAGVADGTQLRLKGQGGRAPRPDQNGDLFLTVRIEPNPVFALAGRDLRVDLPVWDYEAALGAEITAPTVDGRVSLKIPAGSQTGRVMRLRGRGLPAHGKEPAGDLLYELKVLAPSDLNAKERALMQDLADSLKARGIADPRDGTDGVEMMRS